MWVYAIKKFLDYKIKEGIKAGKNGRKINFFNENVE